MATVYSPEQRAALDRYVQKYSLYPDNHYQKNDAARHALGLGLTANHLTQARTLSQQISNALTNHKQFPNQQGFPGQQRENSTADDAVSLRSAWQSGSLIVKRALVSDVLTGNTNGITLFPSIPYDPTFPITHLARCDLSRNNSCIYDQLFTTCTNFGGSNINSSAQSMRMNGGAWHINKPSANYNYTYNRAVPGAIPQLTMESIGIQTSIFGTPDIHPFGNIASRHTDLNYSNQAAQFWAQGQNLDQPLGAVLRNNNAYIHCLPNIERGQTVPIYQQRFHDRRWQQLMTHGYNCHMFDGGRGYVESLGGQYVLKPGRWLDNPFMINQCHLYNRMLGSLPANIQPANWITNQEYDRVRSRHFTSLIPPIVENYDARKRELLGNIAHVTGHLSSGDDIPANDGTEEGKYVYASSDQLEGRQAHLEKQDRKKFNKPGHGADDGFQRGHSAYFIRHSECDKGCYEAISSQASWGHENILKCRFPIIPFSAMHVINGPALTPFTDMKIIKHYDCFRPMKTAEMWWFEVLDRPFQWEIN